MVHDINQYGVHREHKTTTTLKAMTKAKLIEYIRILEHDYNVAVEFNERQARNIEAKLKENESNRCVYCQDGRSLHGQKIIPTNYGWQVIKYCPNCGAKMSWKE